MTIFYIPSKPTKNRNKPVIVNVFCEFSYICSEQRLPLNFGGPGQNENVRPP